MTVVAKNDAPTISEIGQIQSVDLNTSKYIVFTMNDVDNTLGCNSMNLSYTSSNTNLFPSENAVEWRGTWPNCMAVLTPNKNTSGDSVITFFATDGSAVASRSFTLSVLKTSAVISSLVTSNEYTLLLGQSKSIPVALNNATSNGLDCSNLLLTKSDAPQLLPNPNITIEGKAPQCVVKVSSQGNTQGEARLTVGLPKGDGQYDSQLFTIKIKAVSAAIDISTTQGQAPSWITLSGLKSTSLSGVNIVDWKWYFGDGTDTLISPGMTFKKLYTNSGTYSVKLVSIQENAQSVVKVM